METLSNSSNSVELRSSETAIIVENIGKTFSISHGFAGGRNQLERIIHRLLLKGSVKKVSHESGWKEKRGVQALEGVSFTLRKGEILGVLGGNGSGKSVLLKIISQVIYPTTGSAQVYGRVISLLELGVSLHPQLTGRENIYVQGALFGVELNQIGEKMAQIIEMSEIGDYLDQPTRFYSNGMKSRLSFAIAWHAEPDILILDEVLSTSDKVFKDKCIQALKERAANGHTTLLVSHDNEVIRELCTKALWLDRGKVLAEGPTSEVLVRYIQQEDQII